MFQLRQSLNKNLPMGEGRVHLRTKKRLAGSQEKETSMRSTKSKTKVLILTLDEFAVWMAVVPPFCLVLYHQQSSTSAISFVSNNNLVRDVLSYCTDEEATNQWGEVGGDTGGTEVFSDFDTWINILHVSVNINIFFHREICLRHQTHHLIDITAWTNQRSKLI